VNRTYQLAQPLHIEKHVVSAQLFFTGESLRAVTLAFIDARFARSWEDWSEAKELGRRDEQNEWLRTLLGGTGPRWQRPWGKVESVSDPKTGGSSIVISYE
jgi:hypothetical protein